MKCRCDQTEGKSGERSDEGMNKKSSQIHSTSLREVEYQLASLQFTYRYYDPSLLSSYLVRSNYISKQKRQTRAKN